MTERTEAFLLRATPYGESDLVVALLTARWGRVAALARGARRSRRRFGGALDYFHLVEAEVRPGRSGLGRLVGVDLLRSYRAPRESVDSYRVASHVLEVALLGTREGNPDPEIFALVEGAFAALERGADPVSLARVFQARALAALGYRLPAESCTDCGVPHEQDASHRDAALLCPRCAGPSAARIGLGSLRTLRSAGGLAADRLGTIRVTGAVEAELGPLLESALASALGRRPRSLDGLPSAPGVDPFPATLIP